MSMEQAEFYHAWQVNIFADAGADCVAAITMTNVNEAIGVARAAKAAQIPSIISFTLETDGRLPTGETLAQAIEAVDRATEKSPASTLINCAHPTHFSGALDEGAPWVMRLRGLRANSSCLSHAEIDNAPGTRHRQPERTRRSVCRALAAPASHQRARRLLRDGSTACGLYRRGVPRQGVPRKPAHAAA